MKTEIIASICSYFPIKIKVALAPFEGEAALVTPSFCPNVFR